MTSLEWDAAWDAYRIELFRRDIVRRALRFGL